jgi:putative transposase
LTHDGPDISPNQRSIVEKYHLVMESKTLSEQSLGEWIRKHGLHTEHLTLWERELEGFVKNKDQDLKKEIAELKKENQKLKKEAKRDKAAMAEALALLTLKKKSGGIVGPGRGGLIPEDRKILLVQYIQEAVTEGARVKKACECLELSYRSYLRWKQGFTKDQRKGAAKRVHRKLTPEETQALLDAANSEEFRDKTPGQIVATLLERGIYHGSESSLYRILRKHKALGHRRSSRAPVRSKKPQELVADAPNQVWTWDITWLPTAIKGIFLFAYVIIDIFPERSLAGLWRLKNLQSWQRTCSGEQFRVTEQSQCLFTQIMEVR